MATTVTAAQLKALFPRLRLDQEQWATMSTMTTKINEAYAQVERLARQTGYDLVVLSAVQQRVVDLMTTLRAMISFVFTIGEVDIDGRNLWARRLQAMINAIDEMFTGCQMLALWNNPAAVPFVSFVLANEANEYLTFESMSANSDLPLLDGQRIVDYFCALIYAVMAGVGYDTPANFSLLAQDLQNFYRETVKSLAAVIIGSSRASQWQNGETTGPDANLEFRLKSGIENLQMIATQKLNLV